MEEDKKNNHILSRMSDHVHYDMELVRWIHGEEYAPSRRLARSHIFCKPESDCPMENGYDRPRKSIHMLADMPKMIVIQKGMQNGPSLMPAIVALPMTVFITWITS
ncbi:hypothetical protein SUGI_0345010 [Cryptomeria japonica]|nr:hypothetical protein SUGI_0345010 [Cryptomeria japonica]